MNRVLQLAASLTAVALLAGCASDQSGDVYSRDEARQVQTVRTGTITALRPVTIEGTKSPVGAGAGAVVGGIGGSAIGGGRGSFVTPSSGAVAGGLLGAATEEGFTKASGVEITVKEDDGGSPRLCAGGQQGRDVPRRRAGAHHDCQRHSRVAPN